jgi:leucyl-tRNA synthetase
MQRYNPSEIEPKWQKVWEDQKANEVGNDTSKIKTYVSGMFPYPSGAGMHTGHAFSWAIVDAIARFNRQHGHAVLNPIGWDTFGLPAENYAIKTGTAPAKVTAENIANFKNQFKRMGVSIDWSREINTSDPEYYRWTQWVFTKLFEKGLAYQKESLQWWCPVDKTVLANEQVEAGHCWRCGSLVEKKSMKQWFFKITEYADALLDEIEDLDWPQKIKTAQTNWIGKSVGAEIEFVLSETASLPESEDSGAADVSSTTNSISAITVFTTRPDTIFGATFLVLAPEHPLAMSLATGDSKESTEEYIKQAIKKSEIERTNDTKEKTGVFTGSYAVNPATGEKVPIWVADYVLGGYGTGAIMAVPGHDERDFAFASKYKLPIVSVIAQDFGEPLPDPVDVTGPVVIGYDPHTKEFMSLINKRVNKRWLVAGGLEEGETYESAARRELKEEAGFATAEAIIPLGDPTYSYFYNSNKDSNRRSFSYTFLAIINRDDQVEQQQESHEDYEVVWSDLDAIMKDLYASPEGNGHWIETLNRIPAILEAYETNTEPVLPTYHGEGVLFNSDTFNGMPTSEAREQIVAWLEQQKLGKAKTTYKMRDWSIGRQRYWGAPIPIIHCPDHGAVAVPEDQLPVILPEIEDYAPKGDGLSALARAEDWVNTTCPDCGGPARREADTMDGFACSSWYLLRYTDPHNAEQAWDPEIANYWNPVDVYVGGDHAVMHLLYVRFWTHVFNEMGLVNFKEPVKKLVYHGYINAEDGTKMSKSKGNVVDPLDVIDQGYGADALRTYMLFMGPIELDAAWNSKGIAGVYRFLNRIWTLVQQFDAAEKNVTKNDDAVRVAQHKTIKKVTDDFRRLSFNTAISGLMEYVNDLYRFKIDGFSDEVWSDALTSLVQLVAPFAPHMADELWSQLGGQDLVQNSAWPEWDENLTIEDTITIAVQVNGKLRGEIQIPKDLDPEEVKAQALAHENVARFVGDQKPTKVIYVPGRLVSIVL